MIFGEKLEADFYKALHLLFRSLLEKIRKDKRTLFDYFVVSSFCG